MACFKKKHWIKIKILLHIKCIFNEFLKHLFFALFTDALMTEKSSGLELETSGDGEHPGHYASTMDLT